MKQKLKELGKVFLVFIIGSILGYIFEMIVVLFQKGHFESRQGVIYGPFTPVYGIGIIMYYIFFKKVEIRKLPQVFLVSMILGGATEYICSFIQEQWFGTISWDYSNLPFNLNGRTSLLHCTYWGIGGILYIKFVLPLIDKMDKWFEIRTIQVLTVLLAIFMTFNIIISIMAGARQTERQRNIEPENAIDRFLDTYYPDEYMNKVFANKKYT